MKLKMDHGEERKENLSAGPLRRTPLLQRKSLQPNLVLPDICIIDDDVRDDITIEDCVFETDYIRKQYPGTGRNNDYETEVGRKSLSFENIFSPEYEAAVISDIGKTSLHNSTYDHHHSDYQTHHHNNNHHDHNNNSNNSDNSNSSSSNNIDANNYIENTNNKGLHTLNAQRRCLSLQDITNPKLHLSVGNEAFRHHLTNHDHDHCDSRNHAADCEDCDDDEGRKYNSGSSHRWDSLSESMSELRHELTHNHINDDLPHCRQEESQMPALPFAIQEVPDIYVTDTPQTDVNSKVESWLQNSFSPVPPTTGQPRRSNSYSIGRPTSTQLEESVIPLNIPARCSGSGKGTSSSKESDNLNLLKSDKRSFSDQDVRTENSKLPKKKPQIRLGISFSDGSLGSRRSQISSLSSAASPSPMPQRKVLKSRSLKRPVKSNMLSLPSLPTGRTNGLVANSNEFVDNSNSVIKERLIRKNTPIPHGQCK